MKSLICARGQGVCFSLLVLLALPAWLPSAAEACGWDSDTVWVDAQYMKDVLAVMVGRFPRNPPLYYEMRLERTKKELALNPANLAAYDDAAVACDRLERQDEAIALLDQKKRQLDALPDSDASKKEHLYRYFSNLGTVHYHRWLKQGASRKELADVQRARQLLGEAIRVNASAHFGREKYQVLAMDFILKPPKELVTIELESPEQGEISLKLVPSFIKGLSRPDEALAKKYPDAVRGLSGLIALGSSWENVDVFHSLALVLRLLHQSPALSAVASLRAWELIDQKKKSLYPGAPADQKSAIGFPMTSYSFEGRNWEEVQRLFGKLTRPQYKAMKGKSNVEKQYYLLRQEADAWSEARTRYLTAQLQAGKHPDTHPGFWSGFAEPELPYLSKAQSDPKLNLLLDFDGERPAEAAPANKK